MISSYDRPSAPSMRTFWLHYFVLVICSVWIFSPSIQGYVKRDAPSTVLSNSNNNIGGGIGDNSALSASNSSSILDEPQSYDAIRSPAIIQLILFAGAVMFPILLGHIIEVAINLDMSYARIERLFLSLALFVSFLGQFLASFSDTYTSLFMSFMLLQVWVVVGCFLLTMHRIRPDIYTAGRIYAILVSIYAWVITDQWDYLLSVSVLLAVSFAFCLLGFTGFTCLVIAQYYHSSTKLHVGQVISEDTLVHAFSSRVILATLMLDFGLAIALKDWRELSHDFLVCYYLLATLCNVCITLVPGCAAHFNTSQQHGGTSVDAAGDGTGDRNRNRYAGRRAFVRFISHELRTPLSVLSLGLDLLDTQLRPGTTGTGTEAHRAEAARRVVADLRAPCAAGVALLDELLLLESLQSGGRGAARLARTVVEPSSWLSSVVQRIQLLHQQSASGGGVRVQLCDDTLLAGPGCGGGSTVEVDARLLEKVISALVTSLASQRWQQQQLLPTLNSPPHDATVSLRFDATNTRFVVSVEDGCICSPYEADDGMWMTEQAVVAIDEDCLFTALSTDCNGCSDSYSVLPPRGRGGKEAEQQCSANRANVVGSSLGVYTSQLILAQHGERLYAHRQHLQQDVRSGSASSATDTSANRPVTKYAFTLRASNSATSESLYASVLAGIATRQFSDTCHETSYPPPYFGSLLPSAVRGEVCAATTAGEVMSGGSKRSVLIVDDSALNRKMLRTRLELEGFECEVAEDGDVAVARIQLLQQQKVACTVEHDSTSTITPAYCMTTAPSSLVPPPALLAFDVITMDNTMPRMCGPEATARIRQLGYSGLIVGVTGNVLPEDVAHFLHRGADAVLPKPLDMRMFRQLVPGG